MARPLAPDDHRESLLSLIRRFGEELGGLLSSHWELARVESAEKLRGLRRVLVIAIVAVALVALAAQALTAGAVLTLALWLPLWGAALLVGALLGLAGGWTLWVGISRLRSTSLRPEHTIQALKESKDWLLGANPG